MKPKLVLLIGLLFSGALAAQNLLTSNPDFDSGPGNAFFPGPAVDGFLPGWRVTVDGVTGLDFVGTADDQAGIGTPNFVYCYGNATLETAVGSRAPVTAGTTYFLGGNLRPDKNPTAGVDVHIDWYNNNTDYDPAGRIGTTVAWNPIADIPYYGGGSPFIYSVASYVAPVGAQFAAVRFTTKATNTGILADDFYLGRTLPARPLPFNGNFEASMNIYVGDGGEGTFDLFGWRYVMDSPASNGTYAGVADDQGGIGQQKFTYLGGLAHFETTAAGRVPIEPGKDYVLSYSLRHDNGNNLGADVFIDWYDNRSGYSGLVGSSSLGNQLAATTFGGSGSAFENFTSAPQTAPPGATHAAVRVRTRNTTIKDEFGTVTLSAGVLADNFVLVDPSASSPSASSLRLISSAINRTTSEVTLRWVSSEDKNYRITGSTGLVDFSTVLIDNIVGQAVQTEQTAPFPAGNSNYFFRVEEIANLIDNYSFDVEGFDTQTPSGWSEGQSVAASYTENNGGTKSGTRHGTHSSTSPYSVYTYQVKTSLTNGLYTARAWARSSGGQNDCYLEVKNHGGTYRAVNIPVAGTPQLIEITDINVTNGQATIGIWSDANAGNWCMFDDVEFIKK